MQAEKHFQTATLLFYENKLEQALLAITHSINLKPASLSFNNRALIHLHIARPSRAKEDIEMALSIDHLNYAAYFNLSSINNREGDASASIQNLACAVSALRLIYGRMTKQKAEVAASLQACSNNGDALVLLVLMEVAESNFKEALKIVTKYERYQDDKNFMQKLHSKLEQLVEKYSFQREDELYELFDKEIKQTRLVSSVRMKNRLLEEEMGSALTSKLQEFNKYYGLVTHLMGKTQHLPKSNEHYILMQPHSSTKAKNFHEMALTEMIASH